jgi:hypothetical protein
VDGLRRRAEAIHLEAAASDHVHGPQRTCATSGDAEALVILTTTRDEGRQS